MILSNNKLFYDYKPFLNMEFLNMEFNNINISELLNIFYINSTNENIHHLLMNLKIFSYDRKKYNISKENILCTLNFFHKKY